MSPPPVSNLDTAFSTWSLGDQLVTPKGGKICLLSSNGSRVTLQPSAIPVLTPFAPSTFYKQLSGRINLSLQCSDAMIAYFECLDAWTKDYVHAHAERLLKEPTTREEIEAGYHSPVSRSGEYLPLLRTKITLDGPKVCKFWGSDGKPRAVPEDWKYVGLRPAISISHLYIMGKEFGWVILCTDLEICDTPPPVSPFARPSALEDEDESM